MHTLGLHFEKPIHDSQVFQKPKLTQDQSFQSWGQVLCKRSDVFIKMHNPDVIPAIVTHEDGIKSSEPSNSTLALPGTLSMS